MWHSTCLKISDPFFLSKFFVGFFLMEMERQRKHLYLLDVVIKRVYINSKVLLKSFSFDPNEITALPILVKVKFSDFFSIEIDKEGTLGIGNMEIPKIGPTSEVEEMSGTLCIFPLSTEVMESEMRRSQMYFEFFTKTEEGITPILLGRTKLGLELHFLETVCQGRSPAFLPASKKVDLSGDLTNVFGEKSGQVDLSIRFTCFGNALMSDFKSNAPLTINELINKQRYIHGVSSNCSIFQEKLPTCTSSCI